VSEKRFKVVLRRYDDFPGHYREYDEIVACVVRADGKEQIRTSLQKTLEKHKDLTLLVNEFEAFSVDELVSHVAMELQ
jgi:hypothetical protein